MDYQIVISPALKIDPAAFIAAWNQTPHCRQQAEAKPAEDPALSYSLDPELVRLGVVALVTAVGTAAAQGALEGVKDAVKDLVKTQTESLLREIFPAGPPPVEVATVPQADGSLLFVVKEQEPA